MAILNSIHADVAITKFKRRVVPLLFACQVVGFLDRYNVGFAALQMNSSLGLSPSQFGFGAGIFFWGYFVCEIPSAIMLARFGTRVWITRIMITWGSVCMALSLVDQASEFYVLRFLLGGAEAGFYPSVIYFVSQWVPANQRASILAIFVWSALVAAIIGGPIAALLMSLDGLASMEGWQWLFIVEGLAAVILGFGVMRLLPNYPREAHWLSPDEQSALAPFAQPTSHSHGLRTQLAGLKSYRVWLFGVALFLMSGGLYGLNFWLPQILKSLTSAGTLKLGLLTAIPYVAGSLAMWFIARHSDRANERHRHILIPAVVGAAALFALSLTDNVIVSVATVSTMMVLYGALPPFWSLVSARLAGPGAATAIATVTSIGALAGAVGPVILGVSQEMFGSVTPGVATLGVGLAAGALLLWATERRFMPRSLENDRGRI